MDLTYPPFANNARIQRAAINAPALMEGEKGAPVAILQGALLDLGYKMPISTKIGGKPDGIYGKETKEVVRQFQAAKNLADKDGIAGRDTFKALDQAFKPGPAIPKPPVPPPPPPLPSTDEYEVGTGDPPIKPDAGAGPWNSVDGTFTNWAEKQAILEILPDSALYPGPHAMLQMKHYLDNTGDPFTVDLEAMIKDVPSAKVRFQNEVSQAKEFVEMLPVGTYQIRSKHLEQGYNTKAESPDWFFAVGGYSTWGVGKATVRDGASGREYELDFEYRFYDRYNWDRGKHVKILGVTITDEAMGEFHRQGRAREYDVNGSAKRHFIWQKGQPIPPAQYQPSGGR